MKIANRDSSSKTSKLEPFKGSNLYGQKEGNRYVVYSYGYHFPLYIMKEFSDGHIVVLENMDKYSVSTSRHKSQARPRGDDFIFVESNTADLKALL